MLGHIYSVYDVKAVLYMRPFVAQADGEAARLFSDLTTDVDHPMGKHPEDYSLYRLGSFNDQDGAITVEAPECLLTGMQAVAQSTVRLEDR